MSLIVTILVVLVVVSLLVWVIDSYLVMLPLVPRRFLSAFVILIGALYILYAAGLIGSHVVVR